MDDSKHHPSKKDNKGDFLLINYKVLLYIYKIKVSLDYQKSYIKVTK